MNKDNKYLLQEIRELKKRIKNREDTIIRIQGEKRRLFEEIEERDKQLRLIHQSASWRIGQLVIGPLYWLQTKVSGLLKEVNQTIPQNIADARSPEPDKLQSFSKSNFLRVNGSVGTYESKKWPYEPIANISWPSCLPDGNPWPKISIVTPSYEQGKYIEETILSVINQQYPNLEYIIIDGNSKDDTVSIVGKYEDQISYFISEPDHGQSNAINKGFRIATGEILTWLNSDDRLAPGALFATALAFHLNPTDLVAGICTLFRDGKQIEQHITSYTQDTLVLEEILDVENNWLKGKFFYQPEVMFNRSIWERAGGFVDESLHYSMDYELWVRFAAEKASIQVIGTPIAQFRMHQKQKTSNPQNYLPELLKTRDDKLKDFNIKLDDHIENKTETKSLRITMLNDVGFVAGAGIAHDRIAKALSLAGHNISIIACTSKYQVGGIDLPLEQIISEIKRSKPDLMIIGNLHYFAEAISLLDKISKDYPTVFVAHDQWLMTGRCAYTGTCEKYLKLCDEHCPTYDQYPSLRPELIESAFRKKRHFVHSHKNLTILGLSNFTRDWFRKIQILNETPSEVVHSNIFKMQIGLELDKFYPRDKMQCRKQLGLSEDSFIIITSAVSLEDNRKNTGTLFEAVKDLQIENLHVLAIGHHKPHNHTTGALSIQYTGYLNDPNTIAKFLSASDLFVGTAKEEAFGQTFIEAASCGLPSVGFNVGGVSEAIIDGVTGRLVQNLSPTELGKMIYKLYLDKRQLNLLSSTAPIYVRNNFSLQASYLSLLESFNRSKSLNFPGISKKTSFTTSPSSMTKPVFIIN